MLQIIKFVIVGSGAAGVHLGMLFLMVDIVGVSANLGNIYAFFTAFVFSYLGQSCWTFHRKDRKNTWQGVLRFFIVQVLFNLLLNQGGFLFLYTILKWHYLVASISVLLIVAIINFCLSKYFVFK